MLYWIPLNWKSMSDAAGTTGGSDRGFSTCPTTETPGIRNLVDSILVTQEISETFLNMTIAESYIKSSWAVKYLLVLGSFTE